MEFLFEVGTDGFICGLITGLAILGPPFRNDWCPLFTAAVGLLQVLVLVLFMGDNDVVLE